jgi:hypothetical protein
LTDQAIKRAPYAALGAAAGAGDALLDRGDPEKLRGAVEQLRGKQRGGNPLENFGQSLRLMRAQAQLAAAEHQQRHPTGHVLAGGLTGAAMGALAGPTVHQEAREAWPHLQKALSAFRAV